MKDDVMTQVYQTTDYDKFKFLQGNRTALNRRVVKLKNSIQEFGYIPNPIIVNDNFEIIDGMGRFTACKELELPITYIKVKNLGLKECIALNAAQTNWSCKDYVNSYAESGNQYYVTFKVLCDKYSSIGMHTIAGIMLGFQKSRGGGMTRMIKEGRITTNRSLIELDRTLSKLQRYEDYAKHIGGEAYYYYMALAYCMSLNGIDEERLYDKFITNIEFLLPAHTIRYALENIEKVYNRALHTNRIEFALEWDIDTKGN